MLALRRATGLYLVGVAILLAACSSGSATGSSVAQNGAATATPVPSSTATIAAMGTPPPIPAGWQVYHAPHFTIAYPLGWNATQQPQGNSTPSQPVIGYGFQQPNQLEAVDVNESDNVDAATLQGTFCKNTSSEQMVTLAGLQMRYESSDANAALQTRDWTLITSSGTVYQLHVVDGLKASSGFPSAKDLDTAIVETFRPQYTTSGCN